MEIKQEQGMINDRITGLEKRIGTVDNKVEALEDKVDIIDSKHNDRHIEMVKLTTELKGSSKATEQNTNRMANSIEGLVDELKQSNSRTDDRFKEVNTDIQEVKTKVEGKEQDRAFKLEEKKLSNGVTLAIVGGIIVVLQVFIQVVAPLIFK